MNEKPIRELRNLGPACERDLNAVGIYTLADIKTHGVEGTFLQMMQGRRQNARKHNKKGGTCFNAAYLYALYGAVHDLDWREVPEAKKKQFKKLTQQLRDEFLFKKR